MKVELSPCWGDDNDPNLTFVRDAVPCDWIDARDDRGRTVASLGHLVGPQAKSRGRSPARSRSGSFVAGSSRPANARRRRPDLRWIVAAPAACAIVDVHETSREPRGGHQRAGTAVLGRGSDRRGTRALSDLLALGNDGEGALFSQAIEIPTVQVRRRWLRYVASRPQTTSARLLERVRGHGQFDDIYPAADLFAGLADPSAGPRCGPS